jgi:hypothetical protein
MTDEQYISRVKRWSGEEKEGGRWVGRTRRQLEKSREVEENRSDQKAHLRARSKKHAERKIPQPSLDSSDEVIMRLDKQLYRLVRVEGEKNKNIQKYVPKHTQIRRYAKQAFLEKHQKNA